MPANFIAPKIPTTPATLAEYQATMGGRSIFSFHRPVKAEVASLNLTNRFAIQPKYQTLFVMSIEP
jgi:hypothetical protein